MLLTIDCDTDQIMHYTREHLDQVNRQCHDGIDAIQNVGFQISHTGLPYGYAPVRHMAYVSGGGPARSFPGNSPALVRQ